jgi:hypothetical protein
MFLDHTATIQLAEDGIVWQEQVLTQSQRSYVRVSQPVSPPIASPSGSDKSLKTGISIVAFNSDGTLVATRDDSTPTTVWIWDMTRLAAAAAVIQHSPIRQLSWHPTNPSKLLILSGQEDPVVHTWDRDQQEPSVSWIGFKKTGGRIDQCWLRTKSERMPALLLSDSRGCVVAWPEGKGSVASFRDGEGDESFDSVYEALTGRSSTKYTDHTERLVSEVDEDQTEFLDDTFVGRKQLEIT